MSLFHIYGVYRLPFLRLPQRRFLRPSTWWGRVFSTMIFRGVSARDFSENHCNSLGMMRRGSSFL